MPSLKPHTATVVIYRGDDLDDLADLRRAVDVARRRVARADGASLRLGDALATADAEEAAYDAFVAVAAERATEVKLRHIGRRRFRDLLAAHPPREVDAEGDDGAAKQPHPDDDGVGVNVETFPLALVGYVDEKDADVRTIVSPEFSSPKERQTFLDDELRDGDFETIWATAYGLNRSPSADPKASLYGPAFPSSTET